MGNGPPILLTLIAGSCLLIIYRLYPPSCQRSLRAPLPMTVTVTNNKKRENLLKIPRRKSNYTVRTSAMELRMEDIPGWTSCPPATTSHSIWSMAVTEKEALYSSVAAVSIKVTLIKLNYSTYLYILMEKFRKIGIHPILFRT